MNNYSLNNYHNQLFVYRYILLIQLNNDTISEYERSIINEPDIPNEIFEAPDDREPLFEEFTTIYE